LPARKRERSRIRSLPASRSSRSPLNSGVGILKMDIENISLEEICKKVNIQPNLIDLQSNNREKIKSALTSLAAFARLANRKDSLYALVGYYFLEVHTLEEIEFFFNATKSLDSPDLAYFILRDLTQKKDASKRRIFMNDLFKYIAWILRNTSSDKKDSFRQLVESAQWGEKLKWKFFNEF